MFQNITLFLIFGKPLIMYAGITVGIFFLITAVIGNLAIKGKIPFKWHKAMAGISIVLAMGHAIFSILLYF